MVFAAGRIVNRWEPGLPAPERWALVLLLAAIAGGSIVTSLGALGQLRGGTVVGVAVALASLGLFVRPPRRRAAGTAPPHEPLPPPARLLLTAALTLALPFAARAIWLVPVDWDSLAYHLFFPARWIQEQRLATLSGRFPLDALSAYPHGAESVFAFVMVVVRSDLLVKLVNPPAAAACGLAAAALCRRLGGSLESALFAGLTVASTPALASWAATAYAEPLYDLAVLVAVLLVVIFLADPRRSRSTLALAGAAIGFAAGIKYLALPVALFLATLVALGTAGPRATASAPRGPRRAGVAVLLFVASAVAVGGYWYLANWARTGNPVYPIPWFGLPGMAEPNLEWRGSSIATAFGSLLTAGHLQRAWIGVPGTVDGRMALGVQVLWLLPLAMAGALGELRAARPALAQRLTPGVAVVGAAATALATYFVSPFWRNLGWLQADVRFAVPALAMGAALGGAWLARRGTGRRTLLLLSALTLAANASYLDLSLPDVDAVVAGFLWLATATGVYLFLGSSRRVRRTAVAAAAGAAAILALPWWQAREGRRYAQYAERSEVHASYHRRFAPVAAELERRAPGASLAYVFGDDGSLFPYLFLGPRFERRLSIVGPVRDRAAFADAVVASAAELLLVVRKDPSNSWPTEHGWALELGWERRYQDGVGAVFAVSGSGNRRPPPSPRVPRAGG